MRQLHRKYDWSPVIAVSVAVLLTLIVIAVSIHDQAVAQTYETVGMAYGELYEDNASGTTINITDADTYYPWVSTTVGESRNMTLSASTDDITIVHDGVYLITAQVSYAGSNTTIYTWAVHKDGSALTGFKVQRTIGTGTDIGSASLSGIVSLDADEVLNLEVLANGTTKVATVYYAQLNVVLLR